MNDPPQPELPDDTEGTPRSNAGPPAEPEGETPDSVRRDASDGYTAAGMAAPVIARPIEEAPAARTPEAAGPPIALRPPAVWPAIVVVFGGLALGIVAQVTVIAAIDVASGPETAGLAAFGESPIGFITLSLTMEGAFALVAVLAAVASVIPARRQLGLTRAGVPAWGYAALLLGAIMCAAVGEGLSILVPLEMIDVEGLRARMTWTDGALFVVCLAIVPGFVEELLFRGYVQRRLLQRWRPGPAIAVSTLLFALMHIDPKHMVFAAALGLWLGVVAWRTGSIWPGVFCHAGVNALWNIYALSMMKLEPPEHVVYVSFAIFLGSALVGFVVSIGLLAKTKRPPTVWHGSPGTPPA